MTDIAFKSIAPETTALIGMWRRFGELGPVYEIIGPAGTNAAGQRTMRIRVIESSGETDYRLDQLHADPCE
jgi:hypothetical protein